MAVSCLLSSAQETRYLHDNVHCEAPKYFIVQLASHRMHAQGACIFHSANSHFVSLTIFPRIRWGGFSLSAFSFWNRMLFAVGDAVVHPLHEPGKPTEHCLSTSMECLTGWVMGTIWEQAVTYVDQHLSCPNRWLGREPLGPKWGQCVLIS